MSLADTTLAFVRSLEEAKTIEDIDATLEKIGVQLRAIIVQARDPDERARFLRQLAGKIETVANESAALARTQPKQRISV